MSVARRPRSAQLAAARPAYLCTAVLNREYAHLPRSGIDASRRGPDENIPRGRDQTKNAVAATSRDRNPASGALIQDRIAITDAERGDMLARAPPHENGRPRTRRTRVLPVQLTGHQ